MSRIHFNVCLISILVQLLLKIIYSLVSMVVMLLSCIPLFSYPCFIIIIIIIFSFASKLPLLCHYLAIGHHPRSCHLHHHPHHLQFHHHFLHHLIFWIVHLLTFCLHFWTSFSSCSCCHCWVSVDSSCLPFDCFGIAKSVSKLIHRGV